MTARSTIDATELRQLRDLDPEVRIIDVRAPGEYETAHIQGSYNVPLDQLAEHAAFDAIVRELSTRSA